MRKQKRRRKNGEGRRVVGREEGSDEEGGKKAGRKQVKEKTHSTTPSEFIGS